ncbi:hypothetical protein F4808DRAFT_472029 [Astrocystis sublimbata]|nr:hypothetical protein F4808DRAFT_472029 [Astrocystis sublimbata]
MVSSVSDLILRNHGANKPFFRMDEIFRLQEAISSIDRNHDGGIKFQDAFGRDHTCSVDTKTGPALVELRSLQYTIAYLYYRQEDKPPYSLGYATGSPAVSETNETLQFATSPLRSRLSPITSARVREVFEVAVLQRSRGSIPQALNVPARIMEALGDVELLIDNIVCFDLGTFEADLRGPLRALPGAPPKCATHHLLAVQIRDNLMLAQGRTALKLVFQHAHYTDATAAVLAEVVGADCEVVRDNTSAFGHITENSLVIWLGTELPMAVPVKQVIADFPIQTPEMPLPRAMVWPRERPARIEDVLRPDTAFLDRRYADRWNSLSTLSTPRTNLLHQGYKETRIRTPVEVDVDPQYHAELDPFDWQMPLAVYTRFQ